MKKFIFIIAILSITIVLFSFGVSADDGGECGVEGANVTWSFDETMGVLRFNGSGSIKNYSLSGSNIAPWVKSYSDKIKTVSFADGITGVGEYCFYGCAGLTKIVFPSGIEKIGEGALYGCGSLDEIEIGEGNTKYKLENGCLIDVEENSVIRGTKSASIPENVTKIGVGAFSGCDFESFEVPETVIYMGQGAFDGCENLRSVIFPFVGDCRLDKNGEALVKTDEEAVRGQYLYRFGYAFGRTGNIPASLETVIITDTEALGNEAFADYSGLKTVILPDDLVKIGDGAFYACSGLSEITLPESLGSIGTGAFGGCSGLSNLVIPDNVKEIGGSAFLGCYKLKNVLFGISVKAIGNGAFAGCSSLESLTVSDGNEIFYSEGNCIISRKSLALVLGCKNSKIPSNIKSIGEGAFRNCTELSSVTIPSKVEKIGDYAFYKCSGLKTVEIPKSVEEIGEFAFAECVSLSKINLTENVKVGDSAFANCISLKTDSLYMSANDMENGNTSFIWLWISLAVLIPIIVFGGLFGILIYKKRKNENK